jgi:hypothetical protein
MLASMSPLSVDPKSGMVAVLRSMQLGCYKDGSRTVVPSPHRHIFAVGDVADAFGALNAGHTAWAQVCANRRPIIALLEY